jgi:hypothetical protein
MREALANRVSLETAASAGHDRTATKIIGLRTRTVAQAFAVAAVLALWVAPATPAQSAQDAAQSSAQTQSASQSAQAADSSAPQMVDQSAPAADSLADAARKAKAAKTKSSDTTATASTSGAPKVYSNENLGGLSSRGVSYVGSSSSSSSSTSDGAGNSDNSTQSSATGGAAAPGKNEESYWRGRAQEIRNQMADIDRQIARVQDDIAKNGAVSVDPSSGARQGVIMVEDRNAEIKRLEDKKADLQNSLDQLAEEGRKAGADSGWFR